MADRSIRHLPDEREAMPGPIGRSFVEKASSEDTGGSYSVLEFTAPPRGAWGTPHIHDVGEAWYIIEGELTFQVGEETFSAPAGSFVVVPEGVPHANANLGPVPARFLILSSPPGLERYLAEFADIAQAVAPDQPSQEALDALAARHGIVPMDQTEPV
jgi:mannose-6-phosphate isomerase-like protein (cupin superfamily)